ncbi:MAG: hypothetical protein NTW07_01205, partial [candidate division Zixibacteria bacterium]|nr:hypothetical protein [candidate division Zixibacteria bacterium]
SQSFARRSPESFAHCHPERSEGSQSGLKGRLREGSKMPLRACPESDEGTASEGVSEMARESLMENPTKTVVVGL